MSRFFGSKKQQKKYITSAEEYYKDRYGEEEVETISPEEEAIIQKLTNIGAIRMKKTSTFRIQYEFDLPAEHVDDVYHKITLALESNKDINIDAELIEEVPLFLHAMEKQEYKGKVFDSFEGMSVSDFLTMRTNNEKLAHTILDNPDVSLAYMPLLSQIKILSINSNTLSAKLVSLDKLDEFFHLMKQIVKVSH